MRDCQSVSDLHHTHCTYVIMRRTIGSRKDRQAGNHESARTSRLLCQKDSARKTENAVRVAHKCFLAVLKRT